MKLELNCKNHNFEFVKLELSNGSFQLRKQCFNCGEVDGAIYKHSLVCNIEETPPLREDLRSEYYANLQLLYNKQNEDKQKEYQLQRENMRAEYDLYLKSPEWIRKRALIMYKYKSVCVLCFKPAVNVHHLTYDRIYLEDERDLIPLCDNCHKFVHGIIDDSEVL